MDLDTECIKPYSNLFEEYNVTAASYNDLDTTTLNATTSSMRKAFLGRMGTDDDSEHSIPNAWMASMPGHPFWLLPLERIQAKLKEGGEPEYLTGPVALQIEAQAYLKDYHEKHETIDERYAKSGWKNLYRGCILDTMEVLPFWAIYPYSWQRDGDPFKKYCLVGQENFDSKRCKDVVGTEAWGSWSITYWSHSWDTNGGHHVEGLSDGEKHDDKEEGKDEKKDGKSEDLKKWKPGLKMKEQDVLDEADPIEIVFDDEGTTKND